MELLLIILIGFGLAFDVFSIAVTQGCVLGSVRGKSMTLMCLIVCGWQVVALVLGYMIASFIDVESASVDIQSVWIIFGSAILIALGGIKIFLTCKKEAVPEVCTEMNFRKICGIAASTSIYTLFAGIACGIMLLSKLYTGIMICAVTVGLVILGVYVGYRNGEIDKKVYWGGGVLLIVAGTVAILNRIAWCIN